MRKRILSLVLALAAVLSLGAVSLAAEAPEDPVPEDIAAPAAEEPAADEPAAVSLAQAAADQPEMTAALPPESVVHERLMAMQEQWPDGTHWDGNSYYVDKSGYREYGCFGFAIMLQEAAFPGLYGPYRKDAPIRFEDVCVGDMLSTPGHTAIVVERHEDYVVMAEGNMDMGVRWGRTVTAADMGQFQYRWTYYPTTESRYKNGWYWENGGWLYYVKDEPLVDQWVKDNGDWFFVGADGKMLTGLQYIQTGSASDGWYYLNDKATGAGGRMLTGWQYVDGKYYYFDPSPAGVYGRRVTGWIRDGGGTYYCSLVTGAMVSGWQTIDGRRYYFSEDHDGSFGALVTGWKYQSGGTYYYLSKEPETLGQMVTNAWVWDAGVWYFMGTDGKMYEGLTWIDLGRPDDGLYYFSPKHDGSYGHVMDGWWTIHGDTYYFDPNHNGTYGRAYANGTYTIGGVKYTFDSQGRWIP